MAAGAGETLIALMMGAGIGEVTRPGMRVVTHGQLASASTSSSRASSPACRRGTPQGARRSDEWTPRR